MARQLFFQRCNLNCVPVLFGIGFGIVLILPAGDRGHIRLRLSQRHSRLHPREDFHHPVIAVFHHVRRSAEGTGGSRHVHIVLVGKLRNRGQHAHDGVYPVIHLECAPNHLGIAAQLIFPISIADDQHRIRTFHLVAIPEVAAQHRLHAE